jgi:hypothetical protein
MGDDDGKVSKADFVWAMVKLGKLDRETYRKLRELGWSTVEEQADRASKSECPN